jgi:AcrR family transcriptional regulator
MDAMARRVKRSYDTTSRRESSEATRRRIVDASRSLIVEAGYHGATVAAIAERAEVSVATVYELVGRKPEILRELVERAISGVDQPVVAADRDYVLAIREARDATEKLAIYASAVTRIQDRMAPLFLALRDAAATDADSLAVWREIGERRARNMREFATELHTTGQLRTDLSIDEVADVIWTTNSSEVYVLLTIERGWTTDRFEQWLADTWQRSLLD